MLLLGKWPKKETYLKADKIAYITVKLKKTGSKGFVEWSVYHFWAVTEKHLFASVYFDRCVMHKSIGLCCTSNKQRWLNISNIMSDEKITQILWLQIILHKSGDCAPLPNILPTETLRFPGLASCTNSIVLPPVSAPNMSSVPCVSIALPRPDRIK